MPRPPKPHSPSDAAPRPVRWWRPLAAFGRPPIRVRRSVPSDRPALRSFLAALGPDCLAQRFHCARQSLSPQCIDALTDQALTLGAQAQSWVAVTRANGAEQVVALGGWCVEPPRRHTAHGGDVGEVALVVAEAYQGRGIGSRLLGAIRQGACHSGLRQLRATVRGDNEAMLGLLRGRRHGTCPANGGRDEPVVARGATLDARLDTAPGWRWRQALPTLAALSWLLRPLPPVDLVLAVGEERA